MYLLGWLPLLVGIRGVFLTENMSTRMGFEDDPHGGEESRCARVGHLLYGVNRADDEALGRGSERDNLESTLRSSLTTS